MSRIHDALSRGRVPAKGTALPAGQARLVPAALGNKSALPARSRRPWLVLLVLVAAGGVAWTWPSTPEVRGSELEARGAQPAVRPAVAPPTSTPQAPPPNYQSRASNTQPPTPARQPPATPRKPGRPAVDAFQLGLYYQRAGDFEQALVHYKAVLQRDEMNVEAHNNLGGLYLGRTLLDEAAREFQRVIAIEPRYIQAHVNLSATYYKLGRFDAAAAQAREALRIDPRHADAFVNLALAQKGAGQPSEAQATLRRALELDPRHAVAHYNLARQYEDGGETVRAIEHYTQFLQYAGPEQERYAADVRVRLQSLQARTPR